MFIKKKQNKMVKKVVKDFKRITKKERKSNVKRQRKLALDFVHSWDDAMCNVREAISFVSRRFLCSASAD